MFAYNYLYLSFFYLFLFTCLSLHPLSAFSLSSPYFQQPLHPLRFSSLVSLFLSHSVFCLRGSTQILSVKLNGSPHHMRLVEVVAAAGHDALISSHSRGAVKALTPLYESSAQSCYCQPYYKGKKKLITIIGKMREKSISSTAITLLFKHCYLIFFI